MAAIIMPKMSDTMEEGKIIRWLKHEGEKVNAGEPIAEIETDKANVEMEAFEGGIIAKILAKEGDTVPVGETIAEMESLEVAAKQLTPAATVPQPQAEEEKPTAGGVATPVAGVEAEKETGEQVAEEEHVLASPLARRLAEEHGIDVSQVQGTGPGGRVVERDIQRLIEEKERLAPAVEAPTAPRPSAEIPTLEVPAEEHELSKMRRTIAERMTRSKQTVPHFYVTSEIEMDWAARVRDELNADESQVKVSFTDMIIKACALALAKFPTVNASYSEDKVLIHKEINIGFATALDEGLVVPVVRNADKKSLREIAAETKALAQRARENRVHVSDFSGGTFTISNLGMFNVESFTAIINPPEAAALAVGTIREVPVVVDGAIAASRRMKATISADHRLLDGAIAATFLEEIRKNLESPIALL
ncbi:MAG: dihydrolipoamide acetyltransferase family protein [Armatimonadota bacterium]